MDHDTPQHSETTNSVIYTVSWAGIVWQSEYTISLSAKNSNWVKLKAIKQVRWLYAWIGEWGRRCVIQLLNDFL